MKFYAFPALFAVGALALMSQGAEAASADASAARPAGPFLACDGRVGHVSDGARLGRLLLVMGTAGLSEAGMKSDDVAKRATGAEGVAACDEALSREGDAYRRAQLGLARSIHLGEQKKWIEAAAAARAVPSLLGDRAGDWGLKTSATGAAKYLEAIYLARAGQLAAADGAVWAGVNADPYDVVLIARISTLAGLSGGMSSEKKIALDRILKLYPKGAATVAHAYMQAGDYRGALRAYQALNSGTRAFFTPEKFEPYKDQLASRFAICLALAGDAAAARTQLVLAEAALERRRARGDAARNASDFATAEDYVAFARAATLAAEGKSGEAAELLGTRGSWPTIPPVAVAHLVGKVSASVPPAARKGIVATGEASLAKQALDARLAVIGDTENEKRLYSVVTLNQDEELGKLAGQVASGSTKSKWLLKPGKEQQPYELLSTAGRFDGVASGEGLLLHAALMAKARGKSGFVLAPVRREIFTIGVRFLNAGEEGMPSGTIVDADTVIAELGPHIRAAS